MGEVYFRSSGKCECDFSFYFSIRCFLIKFKFVARADGIRGRPERKRESERQGEREWAGMSEDSRRVAALAPHARA